MSVDARVPSARPPGCGTCHAPLDSINGSLGDDFWQKFEDACRRVDEHPERFHFDPSGWRRANLEKFPYHLLFYQELEGSRVMASRHNRQRPEFGLHRK